jgi:dihydroorotase
MNHAGICLTIAASAPGRVACDRTRIEQVVRKSSHNVAQRFDVADRGFIREGYWADLVLADPDTPTRIDADGVLSKCGWSPFEGRTLSGSVAATIVSGEPVWLDGQLTGIIAGQRLHFAR